MMQLTVEELRLATGVNADIAEQWLPALNACLERYDIDTPLRVSHFLGQCVVESEGFTHLRENLNYSAEGLLKVFPAHFKDMDDANEYAHDPERIANRVYAGRYGNGDEASGDGWRYRGGGLIAITFADNYRDFGVERPESIVQPSVAVETACCFWHAHGCNEWADQGSVEGVTKKVNGGLNGLAERNAATQRALKVLDA